ncbi:MAG: HAMP domain-containing histidine kinase [Spartobacteria bacterium]|nr:HAMP domain-containing histidine kinase [Spartobacteria bacterium]
MQMNMDEQDLVRMNRVLRHRLRNLASGIKSSITFLSQEMDDRLLPEEREYFPLFLDACDSIQRVTDRMSLLFDAPPAGAPATLGFVLDRVLTIVARRFPAASIRTTDECSRNLALPAAEPLAIALEEILANAIEAAPRDPVLLDCRQSGDELKCLVYDKGATAVSDDDVREFYQPFFTTRTQHLGIGLPIARKMVTSMDGVLVITPDEAGGMVAELALPLAPVM